VNREELLEIMLGGKSKRSKQREIGPSQIGGCRRKVWNQINEVPKTNLETLGLAAWMGTAIHHAIERRFDDVDPFQERYLREVEVEHNGLMGHVDCYDKVDCEVIDWKTTTKRGLSGFPKEQQIMQVMLYGYLLASNGHPVETVTLVGIARDGNETHIQMHSQPYYEPLAISGIEWLREIRAAEEPPAPEKNVRFCKDYCNWYDPSGDVGCPGLRGRAVDDE